jgi:nicotinamide mononucleotide transporter
MFSQLIENIKATSILEWVAFLLAVAQVVLAIKNNRFNFLFGLISTFLYFFVFLTYELFAEAFLNLYYAFISFIGLRAWRLQEQFEEIPISTNTKQDWIKTTLWVMISFVFLALILNNFTSSNVVYWDSAVSAFAWAGAWLLTRRKIENWILLNISNAISVPLLISKGLVLTSLLNSFLFVMAILGYVEWKKALKNKSKEYWDVDL